MAHRARHHGRGPGPGGRAVAGADPARRRELPDLRAAPRARAHRGARPDQGGRRPGQRRARRARRRHGRRDRRRRRRGRRRAVRRPVPDRRLPDRVGHVEQHERQRGDRDARDRASARRAPQRPRQRQPVVQRRVPDVDPRRRRRRRRQRPHPRARAPGASRCEQGRGVRRRRQVGPHAPDGRDPGDARPGVRRLRRAGPVRRRAAAVDAPPRVAELPLGGTAVGTGINTPAGFAAAVIAELAERTPACR